MENTSRKTKKKKRTNLDQDICGGLCEEANALRLKLLVERNIVGANLAIVAIRGLWHRN
jgi:hypothetical protein